jgi:ankyrin repeat protein
MLECDPELEDSCFSNHSAVLKHYNKDRRSILYKNMFIAIKNGHLHAVASLVNKHGAQIHQLNEDGHSPLSLAAKMGHLDVVKYLVKRGAACPPSWFQNRIVQCGSPLFLAAQEGNLHVVKYLLSLRTGALNQINTKTQRTPLHISIEKGYTLVAEALIQAKADLNVEDRHGATPLFIATQKEKISIADLLLKNGADANRYGQQETTPLAMAAAMDNPDFVRLLARYGARIYDPWSPHWDVRFMQSAFVSGFNLYYRAQLHSALENTAFFLPFSAPSELRDGEGTIINIIASYLPSLTWKMSSSCSNCPITGEALILPPLGVYGRRRSLPSPPDEKSPAACCTIS